MWLLHPLSLLRRQMKYFHNLYLSQFNKVHTSIYNIYIIFGLWYTRVYHFSGLCKVFTWTDLQNRLVSVLDRFRIIVIECAYKTKNMLEPKKNSGFNSFPFYSEFTVDSFLCNIILTYINIINILHTHKNKYKLKFKNVLSK